MTLGQNIQAARKAAGLSQEALAARVGVSRQALGKWEKDTALPGLDNLQALAEALGVSVDALLGAAGEPQAAAGPAMTLDAMRALLDARDAEQARARRRGLCLVLAMLAVLVLLAWGVLRGYRRQLDDANARLASLAGEASRTNASIAALTGRLDELQQAMEAGESTVLAWDYRLDDSPARLRALRNLPVVVRVMPRGSEPGLQAELLADRGAAGQETLPMEEDGGYFTARSIFNKGEQVSLRVRWTYTDGTSILEQLGQIPMKEAELFPQFSWAYVEDDLSFRYYVYPENGTLSLACLPVEVEIAIPQWLAPQSGEIALLVDGEQRAAVPLQVSAADRGGFGYAAAFSEEDAVQPYTGGEVAMVTRLTDQNGGVWESAPRLLTPRS